MLGIVGITAALDVDLAAWAVLIDRDAQAAPPQSPDDDDDDVAVYVDGVRRGGPGSMPSFSSR